MNVTCFICETCGTQFAASSEPPDQCPICEDERQYVGQNGQAWTTHERLATSHGLRIEQDAGLLGIGVAGDFAIPQRALHLPTRDGNVLWETVSLVTEEAVATLKANGGVDVIVISHPHFYASMVEWSEALGGIPILLHADDAEWVMRPSPRIEYWRGDRHRLLDTVSLIRCGGHFAGSTALHWADGPRAGGALFPGDALQVAQDRRHVAFMYSYPNYIPMRPSDVRVIRERVAMLEFDDVYGYTWGRNILGHARSAVDASFERYLRAIAA